ncbi:MAG TPA: ABC transporter permease, partial [Longimicrobiaceae bacterium]|nr:ABC transporter permease [Longimicrobiaceae bacterium]
EGVEGADHVAVISHDLWLRRFGGDRRVTGRTLGVNGTPHTVIGVMPPRFSYPENEQVWVPFVADYAGERGNHYLENVARLKPGVTIEQAQASLDPISRRLQAEYVESNKGLTARLTALRSALMPDEVRTMFLIMLAAVGCVLLVACANVANLMLARATARQREMALRAALGAGRGRVLRQLLTESLMVALLGGALGVLLARWGIDLAVTGIPEQLPYWIVFDIDWRVLAFVLGVSVGTGVVFGLVPAWRASAVDLHEVLKEGGRGSSAGARSGRLRSALVVVQVALSLVLLIGAALMVRSFLALQHVDPGFRTERMLTLRMFLVGGHYEEDPQRVAFLERALAGIAQQPQVESAAAVTSAPLSGSNWSSSFAVEGIPVQPGDEPISPVRAVTADYFRVLGVAVTRGRAFTPQEVADSAAPVVMVSQAFAARYWPNQDPVGRRMKHGTGDETPWLTVVGVVPDLQQRELGAPVETHFYLPYGRAAFRNMTLVVRTRGEPAAATTAVRDAVGRVDAGLPLFAVQSMEEMVRTSFWDRRLYGLLFLSFAAIALTLAAIGIYGVMSYSVAQRTHEIGVRMALGARMSDIVRLVVGHGAVLTAMGVAVGLLGALGVTRVLSGMLVGVGATDPATFVLIPLLLAGVALLASYLPARRAAKVDPLVSLRAE